jgi:hypothetical protein
MTVLITEPGTYPDVTAEEYHDGEICDSPSISSSGVKLITRKSPRHYWHQSNLNPDRPVKPEKQHLALGKALHDMLLLQGRVETHYHVLPAGFNAAHSQKWAEAIDARDYAVSKGKTVLTKASFDLMNGMAESVSQNELACALLTAGTPEMTLAARDPLTGVWMRAKPDVLPHTMEIIPDVKTAADASQDVFERAATRFGYFESAAFYLDVIEALHGEAPRKFVLITIEKEPPFEVVIDHLDDMDVNFARMRNRAALNKFADCLKTGNWYGYTQPGKPIRTLLMTNFERSLINQAVERGELSYN